MGNFLVNTNRALKIADEIGKLNNGNIDFSFATRADQILNLGRDGLKKLHEYGCISIEMGIESGLDDVLKRFKKV